LKEVLERIRKARNFQ